MKNKDPLWIRVEMELSWWCRLNQREVGKCTCPKQAQLKEASPEALKRFLRALEDKTYRGCWKDYLGA